ncbi:hypothetical protein JTE90_019754 [Oedothorax gibbosus]|uniref:Uncharacterized protein n=1 Tax=Oedothorax gibbosus TaxID=931172 RepID=A0AAV6UM56_9ARAC|nr:hypothetical protein JTE90_019754 [Oedothorax gibbosus]
MSDASHNNTEGNCCDTPHDDNFEDGAPLSDKNLEDADQHSDDNLEDGFHQKMTIESGPLNWFPEAFNVTIIASEQKMHLFHFPTEIVSQHRLRKSVMILLLAFRDARGQEQSPA